MGYEYRYHTSTFEPGWLDPLRSSQPFVHMKISSKMGQLNADQKKLLMVLSSVALLR